jgi:hypothetical protein
MIELKLELPLNVPGSEGSGGYNSFTDYAVEGSNTVGR